MTPQKRGRNIMTKAKGLRTVKLGSIDLKWGILASEGFEEEAREYLRGQKVLVGGRLPGAFEILSTFVDSDVKIRIMALEHSSGLSRDELVSKIDEEGLTTIEINRALLESLALAENPSILASMQERWTTFDELQKAKLKAETLEIIQETMKDLERRAKKLGALGSPSSSSASAQTKPPNTA